MKFKVIFFRQVGDRDGISETKPFLSEDETSALNHFEELDLPSGTIIKMLYVFNEESDIWFLVMNKAA